jgi:hypothetical protein
MGIAYSQQNLYMPFNAARINALLQSENEENRNDFVISARESRPVSGRRLRPLRVFSMRSTLEWSVGAAICRPCHACQNATKY